MNNHELINKIDSINHKYSNIFSSYQKEIDELYSEYYNEDTTISLQDLLSSNKVPLNKFSAKSGLTDEEIESFNDIKSITLLAACKAEIGLKKCGIYADEKSLLGNKRYVNLQEGLYNRQSTDNLHSEDIAYLELHHKEMTGINLTYYRIRKGLSRNKLSEVTGVSSRSIETYENGHRNVAEASANTVYALADALDCTIEDLIMKEHLA